MLAIDGGGLKGMMPASFLAEIEESTGRRIADHFDLVAGTSTGGIIALGIGLGLPCQMIVEFYRQLGPHVFGQTGGRLAQLARSLGRCARGLVTSKHGEEPLINALENVFGDRRLGESETRLVIPTWDSLRGQPRLFKTAHHPRFQIDYKMRVVDVAMATAAAPTYLPAHRIQGIEFVDGGVWANNPATIAAVEAVATLGWDESRTSMLSLGCTDERLAPRRKLGLINTRLGIDMVLQAQAHAALWTAKVLLGAGFADHGRLSRVDIAVKRGFAKLDDAGQLPKFEGLGRAQAREWLPRVQEQYLAMPRLPFVPHHDLSAEGSPAQASRDF